MIVRIDRQCNCIAMHIFRQGRVVLQTGGMQIEVDCVEAKVIHTQIKPEVHHIQHLLLNFGVVVVQVRLQSQKIVQVILQAMSIPFPS